ncbi:MAG: TonB-dependent receptor [Nibricoccus sp.]
MKPTHQTCDSPSMPRTIVRVFALGIATILLTAASAFAQQTGTITGQVMNESTGKYLEGAEVTLSGTDLHTTTERDGRFAFRNVPSGAQKIVVNYPGLDASETAVDLEPGASREVKVKLTSGEVITLGVFKVEGTKEGMAQAIALQKVSIESKLVAASDQFGNISEGNIGEYLKFLPGVGVVYNSNDARGVALRGLRSQFTTVDVDGTPMASTSSQADSRRFETEQVSANSVETNEVIKTITADMPANSTGGYINMVTKSAFDRQDAQRIDYKFYVTAPSTSLSLQRKDGTWGKGSHYTVRPNFNINFAKRINDKLGINLNYSLSEIYHDSPRTAYTWNTNTQGLISAAVPGGPTNVVIGGVTYQSYGTKTTVDDPALTTYFMNNEQKLTHREAFAAKVDYSISDATKLTFSGQWNWYDLTFHQRGMQYNLGTSAAGIVNLVGASQNATNTLASTVAADGAVGSSAGRSIQVNDNQRNKYVTGIHFNTTLSHKFGENSKAWLVGYWSQADGKYRDATKGYFSQGVAQYTGGVVGGSAPQYVVDNVLSSPKHPSVLINGGAVPFQNTFDLNNYALLGAGLMRLQPFTALDTKDGFNGHYRHTLSTALPVTIQGGVAYDVTARNIRRIGLFSANVPYTNPLAAGVAESTPVDYGFNYGTGTAIDLYKLYEKYNGLLATGRVNNYNWRRFEEDNKAGYVRADATLFKDLLVVAGARWEERTINAKAANFATAAGRLLTADLKYSNLYPSMTLRYTPNRQWVIRAGYSRTVGDPDYSEIVPDFTAATTPAATDANLSAPSKNLKPYYVNNYDVSVEYYFNKSGVVGGSVFRKEVSGFIVNRIVPLSDPLMVKAIADYNINPADFGLTTTGTIKTNGGDSKINGLELWYNQNLSFLPKPFDGLSLQLNYTLVDIDASDLDTQYAQETDAVTKAINARLSYRWRRFQAAVSTNWTGDVLTTAAATTITVNNPDGSKTAVNMLNIYKAPEIKTKVELSYAFNRYYNVFFEIDNIGYERRENYRNGQALGAKYELPAFRYTYGDPVVRLGVKGSF